MSNRNDRPDGKSSETGNRPRRRPRRDGPRPPSSAFSRAGQGAAASDDELDSLNPGKPKRPIKTKPANLRIIGGSMRGRSVRYHGDAYTRPMKDSVRENLFNILGRGIKGAKAFDLFAGTAALSFESLSRGAVHVTAVEQSKHAVRYIRESAEKLGVTQQLLIVTGDSFRMANRLLAPPIEDTPWVVLLCPPYQMWEEEETLTLLNHIIRMAMQNAPPGSIIVVETDKKFDADRLPSGDWDMRTYGNTRLCFLEPELTCGLSPDDRCGDLIE